VWCPLNFNALKYKFDLIYKFKTDLPSSEERSESLECRKCDAEAIAILLANFICCRAAAASLLKGLGEQRSHKYSSGRLFLLSNTQSTCCQTLYNHI